MGEGYRSIDASVAMAGCLFFVGRLVPLVIEREEVTDRISESEKACMATAWGCSRVVDLEEEDAAITSRDSGLMRNEESHGKGILCWPDSGGKERGHDYA